MLLNIYFVRHTSLSHGVSHFYTMSFTTPTKDTLRCTQNTEWTAGFIFDKIIMEYKNNKCCDMLLTPGACNNQTGSDACHVLGGW